MNKKILCMVLIITLIGSMFLLNTKVKAASGDNVVVQFNDKALWDAMVYRFNCVESSSANKTITYTEEQLKNIKDITITYGDGANISDLTGLERFTSLEHLTIQNTRLLDFTPIKNLKLTHLDLTSGQIKDLSWISGMTTLKILVLYDNQITNIAPLANLTELTGLNLRGNNISDVSALSKLTKLTVFDITGNSNITDIQVIRNFSKIESLDLENLPKANVMQALQNCVDLSKIKKLNISNNNIEDISVLSGATSLEALWAANNKISNIDALSNCKKLNTLYLNGNKNITDISAVAELEELKELQVH